MRYARFAISYRYFCYMRNVYGVFVAYSTYLFIGEIPAAKIPLYAENVQCIVYGQISEGYCYENETSKYLFLE